MNAERFKTCTKCGETKPATTEFFCRREINKDGLYSWYRVCSNASGREWKAANSERHKASRRAWYAANRERALATSHVYELTHKEVTARIRKKHRGKHHEQILAAQRLRRAREAKAEGSVTRTARRRMYEAQEGRCYYCGCELGSTYHTDHIIPVARGGSNLPDNVVVTCPTCNLEKGARTLSEWAADKKLVVVRQMMAQTDHPEKLRAFGEMLARKVERVTLLNQLLNYSDRGEKDK